jgi:haloalkane dehalogenase
VEQFIQHLNLTNILIVVQDWGGPIGMSYAVRHKQNVCGIVVMNSWAWPASVPQRLFSLVMGGWPLGYWLQTRRNFFARVIVPRGIHHSEKVTDNLKKAYTSPFPTPQSRRPTWVFPRQIRKAGSWLRALESQLPILSDVPTKILWGAKDEPGFRIQERVKWQRYLKRHDVEILNDASHFVQEDRPERVAAAIRHVSDDAGKASSAAVGRTPSSWLGRFSSHARDNALTGEAVEGWRCVLAPWPTPANGLGELPPQQAISECGDWICVSCPS